MKPTKLLLYLLTAMFSLMAVSCADDFPYQNGTIPEGGGNLSATITFRPISATNLGGSRTPGDAIQEINSLCVLVYNADGVLVRSYSQQELTNYNDKNPYEVDKDKDHLDGDEAHTDEINTARATFGLPGLPYGRYKIYAVANMGDLSTDEKIKDAILTEKGLRNISLEWNKDNIPANNQMFGYFTPANNMESKGFVAPILVFNQDKQEIHAWLKRAASKVTIAFDPSGLNQGVTIYIRNVTIRDIPKTCLLGDDNTPENVEELLNHLNTPYPEPDYENPSEAIANTRFEYNSNGLITNAEEHTGDAKTDGLCLQNYIREAIPADAHATTAPSLFFYENNQQLYYDEMTEGLSDEDKKKYLKPQQHSKKENGEKNPDGVGTPIRDGDNDKDFKDRIPYGTYIEVEAYYISSNAEKVGEGSIKYRFMLGKNVTDNYNAQRNYHFKLTLGFNGWANEPDWHIDYELPEPGIEVPPVFRVSYLYHQKSELPIRILGDCTDLKVEIIENNWAPYDPKQTDEVPPAKVTAPKDSTCDPTGEYDFEWNRDAYEIWPYMVNGKQVNYYGFLALHMPSMENTTVVNKDYNDTPAAQDELINYYETHHEGDRQFSSQDLSFGTHPKTTHDVEESEHDKYSVNKVYNDLNDELPNQKTLMLPVWTRALTLIRDSGFSGNNPYEGYERKAKLRITATFSDGSEDTKEVTVLQVKRIVNPKGVWRASDRTDAFDVTLLEAMNANGLSNFKSFPSEGEWTAYIESETNGAGFTLSKNADTNGYIENGVIHGYTGSTINFRINFGAKVDEDQSQCAIVKVLYHGNQCLHKILIRKGYSAPVRMGGKLWSTYSLYQATYVSGADGRNDIYQAVLTANPLMLGSMFRRGIQSKGIFVSNNMRDDLGPFDDPGDKLFEVGKMDGSSWLKEKWETIGYRDDVFSGDADDPIRPGRKQGNQKWGLGTFFVGEKPDDPDAQYYTVPTYEDFEALTKEADLGFGVVYGSSALSPKLIADDAYGLIDPYNEGLFDSEKGMRGVVAYSKVSGDQIFFPMGRYGTGRRNNFTFTGNAAGQLRYGDVGRVLANGPNNKNLYRPIPYNLKISSGNIYWIDKYVPNVRTVPNGNAGSRGCLGWDMNYFNFDFNPYTANNWADACPIKLILVEKENGN